MSIVSMITTMRRSTMKLTPKDIERAARAAFETQSPPTNPYLPKWWEIDDAGRDAYREYVLAIVTELEL